jgi:methyl-accepting chemotaxis protein
VVAEAKEVYNVLVMLRDFGYEAPKGKRMDISNPEYAESLDYVQAVFKPYVSVLGYQDALLIDETARILLTVKRKADLGLDLKQKTITASNLTQAWKKVMQKDCFCPIRQKLESLNLIILCAAYTLIRRLWNSFLTNNTKF